MKKNKQYEVLAELYKLNLISRKILLDLSDNIEAISNKQHTRRIEHNLDFIDEHQPEHQRVVLRKVMGEKFHKNAFFKYADGPFVIHLLKTSTVKHFMPGEFIYNQGQPSNNSTSSLT